MAFCLLASAQTVTPRFGTAKNQDNTGRVLTYGVVAKTYSSTITVNPNYYETVIDVATLTGDATVTSTVTNAAKYDKLNILFTADTSTRTVSFGSGFANNKGNLAIAPSTKYWLRFIFNGTVWIEGSR